MITKQINENEYEVQVYDWVELHDDYCRFWANVCVCGHIKRQPDADEESHLRYWMFYPIGEQKPLNVADLRRIFHFMAELNIDS